MMDTMRDGYIAAIRKAAVAVTRPVDGGDTETLRGYLIGMTRRDGTVEHYSVEALDGTVSQVPPEGLDNASSFAILRAGLDLPAGGVDPRDDEVLATLAAWLPCERERIRAELTGDDDLRRQHREEWQTAIDQTKNTPVYTSAGVHAKAVMLRSLIQDHPDFGQHFEKLATPIERMAWSLVRDILVRRPKL